MRARGSAALAVLAMLAGCSGEKSQIGNAEPFRVHAPPNSTWTAQFAKGELPGTAPPTLEDGGPVKVRPEGDGRIRVSFETARAITQGQGGVALKTGIASPEAYSVAIKLDGIGTGYWVIPVGILVPEDKANGNPAFRNWDAVGEFDESIPSGYRILRAVGLDEHGLAGEQYAERRVCITGAVPDNFSECAPGKVPPSAVISLSWDASVDLDLQVRTPDGRFIDAKNPLDSPPDAGVSQDSASLDRDSNAGCRDGGRRENLVFKEGLPPHGLYALYANLFDACSRPSVRFTMAVYSSETGDDGFSHLVKYQEKSGELMDFQANGGSDRGLFVSEFTFR